MKNCPRCGQTMLDVASRCVSCGYEIPEDYDFSKKRSVPFYSQELAYSSFAQLTLEIWAALTLLGIFIAFVIAAVAVFKGDWSRVFFGLLGAWGNFALYVLLRRVADMSR